MITGHNSLFIVVCVFAVGQLFAQSGQTTTTSSSSTEYSHSYPAGGVSATTTDRQGRYGYGWGPPYGQSTTYTNYEYPYNRYNPNTNNPGYPSRLQHPLHKLFSWGNSPSASRAAITTHVQPSSGESQTFFPVPYRGHSAPSQWDSSSYNSNYYSGQSGKFSPSNPSYYNSNPYYQSNYGNYQYPYGSSYYGYSTYGPQPYYQQKYYPNSLYQQQTSSKLIRDEEPIFLGRGSVRQVHSHVTELMCNFNDPQYKVISNAVWVKIVGPYENQKPYDHSYQYQTSSIMPFECPSGTDCQYLQMQDGRHRVVTNEMASSLLIYDPQHTDYGIYRCTVTGMGPDGKSNTLYQIIEYYNNK